MIKRERLRVGGMTCVNCQNRIAGKLRSAKGVTKASVSYSAGTADVEYDDGVISRGAIAGIITNLNYQVMSDEAKPAPRIAYVAGMLAIIVALFALLRWLGLLNLLVPSQLADARMGYGMLFVIGLLTSVHCVAMCGGINISQAMPRAPSSPSAGWMNAFVPSLMYNLGRVISYTVIGLVLGATGMIIGGGGSFGVPMMLQGVLKLAAGLIMIIMGVNMLNLFPWARRFNLRLPKGLTSRVGVESAHSKSPLIVGLLNGLMPCGPMQSMWIVALASGNPFTGALAMLMFSLGTAPLMLGLGSVVSALGRKFTGKLITVGAVLVVVLGLAMMDQGVSLSGLFSRSNVGNAAASPPTTAGSRINQGQTASETQQTSDGVQVVTSALSSNRYPSITVKAGVPVKWVINAPNGSINGCNGRMIIPEYNLQHTFSTGENVIEFTPTRTGSFSFSCWMGMIRGLITVTE